VKTTGIVKGELRVHHDIPEYLRHGVFAYPGRTYPVIARYANEPSYIWDDREPQPRGLGLKVFGVEGSRLPGYEEGNTQDCTRRFLRVFCSTL
jgi:catalase